MKVNSKHKKLLEKINERPTRTNIKFSEVEKLLISLGAIKIEGRGSRVAFVMESGLKWEAHRPHPEKEAREYQIETLREFLSELGYINE